MANTPYENFFLENEIEDQFNSHLDLVQFVTVDNNLELNDGMILKVHKYSATNGTEDVTMGNGNTETIEAGYVEVPHEIKCAQNRFAWYDEQAMKDPIIVLTGTRHMGTDMFNHEMADIYGEFKKAVKVVPVASFNFNAFADAESMFPEEDADRSAKFAFVHPTDVAALRKALGTSLQYVEAYARTGYVGTVAGISIYTKKDATAGTIVVANKDAVTLYNKQGTTLETERNANIRKNTNFSRKYYVVALTNEKKAVKVVLGTASKTQDTEINTSKTYYVADGLGYVVVAAPKKDNIGTYYEIA